MSTITVKADSFIAVILPSAFEVLPITNLRRLFNLMFQHDYQNTEAIGEIETILSKIVADTKLEWSLTSTKYTTYYRCLDSHGYPLLKSGQEKINRPLLNEVKKAKKQHDRAVKIQTIFTQLKEKYNYG